ncbi:MAG: phosphate signaling complex protein PhoU [Pseudonocardiaceae bacterium]
MAVRSALSTPYSLRMRRAFSAELDELIGDVARLARRAGQMMTDASTALWHPDLRLAETIISGDSEITTALCDDIGHRCVRLLALQAPVATDLRLVVAALHAVSDVMRMGKLATHIAKIARLKHPVVSLPDDLEPVFARMALLATTLAHEAARAIENRDPRCAEQLVSVEEEVATLHRQIFQRLFAKDWSHGVEPAVDAALIGRYYTRFADHAVAIARQASFIVTGSPPQR